MAGLAGERFIAASIAVLFGALFVAGLLRMSRLPMLVLMASFLAIPAVGFAVYAVAPRPLSSPDRVYLAFPFAGVAFSAILATILLRLPHGQAPRSFSSILRAVPLTLVFWACMVITISVLLSLFEPELAIANLAANAAWFAAWVPRAARRFTTESTYELDAPRERVFAFIGEPANWPLYNEDVVAVDVRPAGPVTAGSRLTMHQRADYRGLRGPRMLLPGEIVVSGLVTRVVANELIASRRSDGIEAEDKIELSDVGRLTRVKTSSSTVVPYRLAVVGARIELGLGRARRAARTRVLRERLAKLLAEQAPVAG